MFELSKTDFAVVKLDVETVDALKEKYDFLPADQLGYNHQVGPQSKCLVFGYPNSGTRKTQPTHQITPTPFFLRTIGMPESYYQNRKVQPEKSMMLYVDQRLVGNTAGEIEEILPLGGISGCGIWEVHQLGTTAASCKLVGILTGEGEDRRVLFGSRIDHFARILREQFASR